MEREGGHRLLNYAAADVGLWWKGDWDHISDPQDLVLALGPEVTPGGVWGTKYGTQN